MNNDYWRHRNSVDSAVAQVTGMAAGAAVAGGIAYPLADSAMSSAGVLLLGMAGGVFAYVVVAATMERWLSRRTVEAYYEHRAGQAEMFARIRKSVEDAR